MNGGFSLEAHISLKHVFSLLEETNVDGAMGREFKGSMRNCYKAELVDTHSLKGVLGRRKS